MYTPTHCTDAGREYVEKPDKREIAETERHLRGETVPITQRGPGPFSLLRGSKLLHAVR